MNARLLSLVLPLALVAPLSAAEEAPAAPAAPPEPTTTSQATRDAIRARLREDAKRQAATPPKPAATKQAPAPAPVSPVSPSAQTPSPASASTAPAPASPGSVPALLNPSASEKAAAATTPTPAPAKPANDATILPKVEVRQGKPSALANELYEQEKMIAREKQLTKSSELDKALNDPKLSVPILGGQSTASRTSIASERVALLEAEKDVIEQIAMAKTKEQKATLQKELAELKKMRRELEQSVR